MEKQVSIRQDLTLWQDVPKVREDQSHHSKLAGSPIAPGEVHIPEHSRNPAAGLRAARSSPQVDFGLESHP